MKQDLSHLLPEVIDIARSAGQLILDIYQNRDYEEFTKTDDTPVTSADLAAHKLIMQKLPELTPDIPVLSEEDADISLAEREQWERYWLVDPLDGTQEFIARSGDFATIIALVEHNKPVMGVVYGPVSGVVYYAYEGKVLGRSLSWVRASALRPTSTNCLNRILRWLSAVVRTSTVLPLVCLMSGTMN